MPYPWIRKHACFLWFIYFLLSLLPTETAPNRTDKWQSASDVEVLHIETRVGNHLIDNTIEVSTLSVSSISDALDQIIRLHVEIG